MENVNNTSLVKLLDKVKELIDLPEKVKPQLIITSAAVLSSVIFFLLGYFFLYGFFFGGKDVNNLSLVQALINPVPINFKSVVSVGVIFFITVSIFIYPYIKLRECLKENDYKKYIFLMITLVF